MNLKKWLVSTAALLFIVSMFTAFTATAADSPDVKSEADIVAELGVLQGEGDGVTEAYLQKSTIRMQAAIMFLRLKGMEDEALAFAGTDNFADAGLVSQSNQAILAYLKANPQLGWQGVGEGKFDPLSEITAQQYYKVMLEALGYRQDVDFAYENTLSFAAQKGMFRIAHADHLINRNIATATVEALNAKMNGSDKTLAEDLAEKGVIGANQLDFLQYTHLSAMHSETLGDYLADANGKTLYYFAKDAQDPNSCNSNCLANWPVFYAEKLVVPAGWNPADFGVFERSDGTKQTTYKGWPLYYFVKDAKAGDTTGHGVNNVWFVINPANVNNRTAGPSDRQTEQQPAAKTYEIVIENFRFTPAELTIEVGSTVKWTNKDSIRHNAVAKDGTFATPLLSQGESASFTFTKPGEYDYFCEPHKEIMQAKIIVK